MKLISSIIENHIPQFIRLEYPNFVKFIKGYYQWAEQKGEAYEFIANIPDYSNVDRTSLDILEHFAAVYLSPLPDIIYERNNLSTLTKYIVQHYQAKGSEKSIEFLFQLIENREIFFYYPSYDMLRISHGKWEEYKSFKIINPSDDVKDFESCEIIGETSGARAIIDFIELYDTTSGIHVGELYLQELDVINPISKFVIGETFTGNTWSGKEFTGIIEPVFSKMTVSVPGKYYKSGIRLTPESVNGEDASVVIDSTSKGKVESITIVDGGTGYEEGDKLLFTAKGFGKGAYGRVSSVDGSGVITEVVLTFGGYNYTSIPRIDVISDTGTGAVLMAESTEIGKILTYNIRNFGLNYEIDDTVYVPLMARIYDLFMNFDIGEIIDSSSGGVGVIESHDTVSGIIGIRVESGTFDPDDTIVGRRYTASAVIYDTSQAEIDFNLGAVCSYKGRYINNDGHISSTKYIQDSYFYQVFSYMIETYEKRENWVDYINNVHPSGMISFGFREIPNKQKMNESYGGFFGPTLDMTELYRFKWLDGNTYIEQYGDVVIDDVLNININKRDKTNYCFGSEITIT